MRAPVYSVADFLGALQNLLPRGRAWSTEPDSVQAKLEAGLVSTTRQVNLVDAQLLEDAFPSTANFLLPEWEAALGLPDPCAGPATTISERQAQVVTRLTDSGGQSSARFIALAEQLGYTVTTTMFAPFRAGHSHAGDELGGPYSFFTWQVNAPFTTVTYFRAGSARAGDPLASWGNEVLECALQERSPAHTTLGFTYGDEIPVGLGVDFVNDFHYARTIGGYPSVGPFTLFWPFTRNSQATYRHIGEIRYANENLILRSQEMDNASWTKSNATVTANAAVAPDLTTTADKIIEAATSSTHFIEQGVPQHGKLYTWSVYLKAGERQWASLRFGGTAWDIADSSVYFDLVNGVIGTNSTGYAASIDPIGDGWYRCTARQRAADTGTLGTARIHVSSADGVQNYAGDGTSGIYAWGAHLQRGPLLSAYMLTTTATKFDQPRVEYDGTGNCLGLHMEVAATNLCLWSEVFGDANWQRVGLNAVGSNATTAPDNTVTADKLSEDGSGAQHRTRPIDLTITANATYAVSVFVKAAEKTRCSLRFTDTTFANFVDAYFNLTTGTVITAGAGGSGTGATAYIEAFGNGWYRISLAGAIGGGITTGRFLFELNDEAGAGITYTGVNGNGLFFWGAQIEAGLFATSYIPATLGAATRDGDVSNRPLGGEFSATAGTVVVEGSASPGQSSAGAQFVWIVSDLTSNERVSLVRPVSSDVARWNVIDGGAASASMDTTFTNRTAFKHAAAWALDDFAMSFNGAAVTTDNLGTLPTMTHFQLGAHGLASQGNCHIKKFTYYPERKTNAFLELAAA